MRNHLRALASESVVYGISSMLSKLVFVFLVPLYTRVFSPEEYGRVTLVTTVMGAISVLVVLGLDNSAHRWFWDDSEAEGRKRTVASWAWCQLSLSMLFATLLVVLAEPAARLFSDAPEIAMFLRVSAVAMPLALTGTIATNWFRMQRRPWAALWFNLGAVLVSVLGTIYFVVVRGAGPVGVFWAQVAAGIWQASVAVVLLRDWLHPRHFDRERLTVMLRYALPLVPAALSFWVVSAMDRLFVQHYASTADVGIYQVGYAVASVVALGTQAFQQAWGPFSLSIHREADAPAFYARVLLIYLWGTCWISVAVGLLAPEAIAIFAPDAYQGASRVASILAFGFVATGLTYIAGLGAGLARQTRPIGMAITVAAGLNLFLNFLLTPVMGKEGAALATLLSQAIVPVYVFWSSQRLYPIPYQFGKAIAIVVLALGLAGAGELVELSSLWASLAVKLLMLSFFIPALFLLGVVDRAVGVSTLRQLGRRLAGGPLFRTN